MENVINPLSENFSYQKLQKDRDFDLFWLKVRRKKERKKKKVTFRVLLRKLKIVCTYLKYIDSTLLVKSV